MDPTFDTLRDYFMLGAKLVKMMNEKHMKDFHSKPDPGEFDEDVLKSDDLKRRLDENYLEKSGRVRCGNILYKKVEGTDPSIEVYDIELGRRLEE